jgi:hypothetical protein
MDTTTTKDEVVKSMPGSSLKWNKKQQKKLNTLQH